MSETREELGTCDFKLELHQRTDECRKWKTVAPQSGDSAKEACPGCGGNEPGCFEEKQFKAPCPPDSPKEEKQNFFPALGTCDFKSEPHQYNLDCDNWKRVPCPPVSDSQPKELVTICNRLKGGESQEIAVDSIPGFVKAEYSDRTVWRPKAPSLAPSPAAESAESAFNRGVEEAAIAVEYAWPDWDGIVALIRRQKIKVAPPYTPEERS